MLSVYVPSTQGHDLVLNNEELDRYVAEVSSWIIQNTELNEKDILPPEIVIISENALCQMAFSTPYSQNTKLCAKIEGLYDYINKVIYIDEHVDLNSTDGRIVLFHELIHHHQFECGISYDTNSYQDIEQLAVIYEEKFRLTELCNADRPLVQGSK